MKPILFKVTENTGSSFHVQENRDGHQYNQLHYHPEYQISLVVGGSGKCIIGGYNDRFESGDVYMIGANVPHIFESPDSHIISVFFTEGSFGGYFFQLPEMAAVKQFLEEAAQRFKLQKKAAFFLQPLFLELLQLSGAARIIQLLQLLNQLALNAEKQLLAQTEVSSSYSYTALYRRMKQAFHYISDNFDKEISLDDVATFDVPSQPEAADQWFDKRWAWSVIRTAIERMESRYTARGRKDLFAELKAGLISPDLLKPYVEIAKLVGMTESQVKLEVHRARRRLADELRAEVAVTLPPGGDVEEELRYLLSVMSHE